MTTKLYKKKSESSVCRSKVPRTLFFILLLIDKCIFKMRKMDLFGYLSTINPSIFYSDFKTQSARVPSTSFFIPVTVTSKRPRSDYNDQQRD